VAKRAGSADLPLHYGRVPPWLGQRMARLGAVIAQAIIHDVNHILNMALSQPSTRHVATPVTRKVMKKLVPKGRANWK